MNDPSILSGTAGVTRRSLLGAAALTAAALQCPAMAVAGTGPDSAPDVPLDAVQPFGQGVLKSEGVVVDRDGSVYGAGRNGIVYKVDPEGVVSVVTTLPEGAIPNGLTMDRNGDLLYCDLGRRAVLRVTRSGKISLVADEAGGLKLASPNFATYDAEGNLYVSISSLAGLEGAMAELAAPQPRGALVRIRPNGKS
ncbi:MAG: SMP-30/gluconolactonase/LRE family protein, partial [Sphingomonas bacterium]|uniref:SMP-30/gluconolactonase/LRE family protein n=1 Tax=Sphingomonas bacterium TaxID=1895847 RepID=UPI002634AB89